MGCPWIDLEFNDLALALSCLFLFLMRFVLLNFKEKYQLLLRCEDKSGPEQQRLGRKLVSRLERVRYRLIKLPTSMRISTRLFGFDRVHWVGAYRVRCFSSLDYSGLVKLYIKI